LIVLIVIILAAGLFAGFSLFPEPSRLDDITVAPPGDLTLSVGETKQLKVIALYDDGMREFVTLGCDYTAKKLKPGRKAIITVSDEGLITARRKGNSTISVSYIQRRFLTGDITRTAYIFVKVK
ncbi:unnamed protein product, partial [marine sediment metagenome]